MYGGAGVVHQSDYISLEVQNIVESGAVVHHGRRTAIVVVDEINGVMRISLPHYLAVLVLVGVCAAPKLLAVPNDVNAVGTGIASLKAGEGDYLPQPLSHLWFDILRDIYLIRIVDKSM